MFAEFKHTIRRLRGQAIGWSIGMIFYSLLLGSLFDTVTTIEGLDKILKGYPPEVLAFFGNMTEMTTPWGYLDTEYFTLINMILGIFAIGTCVNLIVGDEEKGLLDLILAHPISRSRLYWERLLAFVTVIGTIMLVAWLSLVIPSDAFGFDLSPVEFFRPFLSLFSITIFFSTFALLLSFILPSTRFAGMISGALMVLNFLILGLSRINSNLEPFMKYTPIYYYQGGEAIKGLKWEWFIGLFTASLLFALLAWVPFLKRDIRVSGEHSWSLSIKILVNWVVDKITNVRKSFVSFAKNKIYDINKDQIEEALISKTEDQEKTIWLIILIVALAFIIFFCILLVILIDVTDQWCSYFPGFFNSIVSDICL